jgi:hypothetical protein
MSASENASAVVVCTLGLAALTFGPVHELHAEILIPECDEPARAFLPIDDSPPDTNDLDVAVSDSWLVSGYYGENNDSGAVYVYSAACVDSPPCSVIKKLVPPPNHGSQNPNMEFGKSVAIYEDGAGLARLVIGAPRYNNGEGAVFVYEYVAGEWEVYKEFDGQLGDEVPAPLRPSILTDIPEYGTDVDVEGDTIVAGAPHPNSTSREGFVEIHTLVAGDWVIHPTPIRQLPRPPVEYQGAGFGASLDLDGERLAVGRPLPAGVDFGSGAAFVYEFDTAGSAWLPLGEGVGLSGSASPGVRMFGVELALGGDRLVVATRVNASSPGPAITFRLIDSGWQPDGFLRGLDSRPAPVADVSIRSDLLAAGVPGTNSGDGCVLTYQRDTFGEAWGLLNVHCSVDDILDEQAVPQSIAYRVAMGDGLIIASALSSFVRDGALVYSLPHSADDCDGNGAADACEIIRGWACDENEDLIPDVCQGAPDCDGDGTPDACEFRDGTDTDCDNSGVPDSCEVASDPGLYDTNGDGIHDACPLCSAEIVFLIDTSGSVQTGNTFDEICDLISELESCAELPSGTTIRTIDIAFDENSPGGCGTPPLPALAGTFVEEFIDPVNGGGSPFVDPEMLCGFALNSSEDWANAISIVAPRYPWRPWNATRVIVTLSDEGACNGGEDDIPGEIEADCDALINAQQLALVNGVRVIAMTVPPYGSDEPAPEFVRDQADKITAYTLYDSEATGIHVAPGASPPLDWDAARLELCQRVRAIFDGLGCRPTCPGDANRDNVIDVFDFAIVASNFGESTNGPWINGDFDGDSFVDIFDFAQVSGGYGLACDITENGFVTQSGGVNAYFYNDASPNRPPFREPVLEPFVESLLPRVHEAIAAWNAAGRTPSLDPALVTAGSYAQAIPGQGAVTFYRDALGANGEPIPYLTVRVNQTDIASSALASIDAEIVGGAWDSPGPYLVIDSLDNPSWAAAGVSIELLGLLSLAMDVESTLDGKVSNECCLRGLLEEAERFIASEVACASLHDAISTDLSLQSLGQIGSALRLIDNHGCGIGGVGEAYRSQLDAVDPGLRLRQQRAAQYAQLGLRCYPIICD